MRNEKEKEIRYVDLFGGVGGFRLGIEKACNCTQPTEEKRNKAKSDKKSKSRWKRALGEKRRYRLLPGCRKQSSNRVKARCVFYSDIDKYAVQTYNKNFKEEWRPTDIRQVRAEDIPDFDLLCGGFPCQAFSIAGKRRGFKDTRGTLFFEIARIVEAKRPAYLFLENVKGLLNHEKGQTFRVIIQTLSEFGYDVQWMVLNSKFFGVPQNRERVFIIGSLRGTGRPEILPFREDAGEVQGIPRKEWQMRIGHTKSEYAPLQYKSNVTRTLEASGNLSILREQWDVSGKGYKSQQDRAYHTDGVMCCLPNANPKNKVNIISGTVTQAFGRRGCSKEEMESSLKINRNQGQLRRLTPIECERLQGFPDNWTDICSDTQRYKQMGNAVTVNVIEAIMKKLFRRERRQL